MNDIIYYWYLVTWWYMNTATPFNNRTYIPGCFCSTVVRPVRPASCIVFAGVICEEDTL